MPTASSRFPKMAFPFAELENSHFNKGIPIVWNPLGFPQERKNFKSNKSRELIYLLGLFSLGWPSCSSLFFCLWLSSSPLCKDGFPGFPPLCSVTGAHPSDKPPFLKCCSRLTLPLQNSSRGLRAWVQELQLEFSHELLPPPDLPKLCYCEFPGQRGQRPGPLHLPPALLHLDWCLSFLCFL